VAVLVSLMVWREKAQPGFDRVNDGDASGATYLLGGVAVQPHVSALASPISGTSLALRPLRPVAMASRVVALVVTLFLKASL
jgi:hypothetical protein